MSDFRFTIDIQVPPVRVWSVLLDVERWPEWTTSVTRIQRMEVGPLTLGSRARIWQPRLRPAVWCVTSLDEKRHVFAWSTHTLGAEIIARHQVDALKNHSRVSLSLAYSGPLSAILTRFYGDLTRDYITREGSGLQKFCQSLPASHPATRAEHLQPTAQTS